MAVLQGAVAEPGRVPAPATAPRRRRRRSRGGDTPLRVALLWLGPALLLIFGVVVFPAYELVKAAFSHYSITGLRLGDAGTTNFKNVLNDPSLITVLTNTVIWVCLLYTSPSPRDRTRSRMPSSA